jgi:hypothetical protein
MNHAWLAGRWFPGTPDLSDDAECFQTIRAKREPDAPTKSKKPGST